MLDIKIRPKSVISKKLVILPYFVMKNLNLNSLGFLNQNIVNSLINNNRIKKILFS